MLIRSKSNENQYFSTPNVKNPFNSAIISVLSLRTDRLIQQTIRVKFAECTILTVAHRLHTIIDSDRVLVMDTGRAVEFDEPHNLLQNNDGIFHDMVKALGPQEYERLALLATEKYDSKRKLS